MNFNRRMTAIEGRSSAKVDDAVELQQVLAYFDRINASRRQLFLVRLQIGRRETKLPAALTPGNDDSFEIIMAAKQ